MQNDISISANEVLQSQQDTLDIESFIEEADKYTEDVYADVDMGELFSQRLQETLIMKLYLKVY